VNSLLSRDQRAFVRADTMIDRLIIDRVTDAMDHLIRENFAGYLEHMTTAVMMIGDNPPRPSAVDVVKTICIRAYADRKRWSYRKAHAELTQLIAEGNRAHQA
jgi:hypothetical protein